MELGEKIKAARLEAGLSQRQLCGAVITRNMLSQIEHGTARPSMDTLRHFASQLGKPISYFLDEETLTSPNQAVMEKARAAFRSGAYGDALELLLDYRKPDPVFDEEHGLLLALCRMGAAEQALREGRLPYAEHLLDQAVTASAYFTPELERKRLLLLAQASPARLVDLPSDDDALLIRAQTALAKGDVPRAAACLDAVENQDVVRWHLLRAEVLFARNEYGQAAAHYHRAEKDHPSHTIPRLEACYRELGDFKRAYEYACKQR